MKASFLKPNDICRIESYFFNFWVCTEYDMNSTVLLKQSNVDATNTATLMHGWKDIFTRIMYIYNNKGLDNIVQLKKSKKKLIHHLFISPTMCLLANFFHDEFYVLKCLQQLEIYRYFPGIPSVFSFQTP